MSPAARTPLGVLAPLLRLVAWRPRRLCEAARAALERGELAEAAAQLDEAVARAPQWAEPFHLLARLAAARGDRDGEERLEREALARDPRHREAEEALLALEAWRRKPVMDAWAHYHAARWGAARDAFFDALGLLGVRVPLECRAEILAGIGWCHLELAAYGCAADAFWEALACEPAHVGARKGLAIGWYRLGWYAKSEALLAELLLERPDLGDAWAFHGWSAYGLGRWSDALERFERAQAADPGLADARWGRAWSLFRLRRSDAALAEFTAALAAGALHPSRFDALDVALRIDVYGRLLEPLAVALARAGAAAEVEGVAARAELEPALAAKAARLRAELARAAGDPLLDALQALVERRPEDVERALATEGGTLDERRARALWLRARALELQGSFSIARELVSSVHPRNSTRREWLELAERLRARAAGPHADELHSAPRDTT